MHWAEHFTYDGPHDQTRFIIVYDLQEILSVRLQKPLHCLSAGTQAAPAVPPAMCSGSRPLFIHGAIQQRLSTLSALDASNRRHSYFKKKKKAILQLRRHWTIHKWLISPAALFLDPASSWIKHQRPSVINLRSISAQPAAAPAAAAGPVCFISLAESSWILHCFAKFMLLL